MNLLESDDPSPRSELDLLNPQVVHLLLANSVSKVLEFPELVDLVLYTLSFLNFFPDVENQLDTAICSFQPSNHLTKFN